MTQPTNTSTWFTCDWCGGPVLAGPMCNTCACAQADLLETEWPEYLEFIRSGEPMLHPDSNPYTLTAKGWAAIGKECAA